MPPWTATALKALKGKEKIVCLTAYDYATARVMDDAGVHLVLVGDSLAMTMLGYDTTLPVTMDQMIHHAAAVVRGTRLALVVGDMPFMSFQVSTAQAIQNAGRFIKEAGVGAVKIEGGAVRIPVVKALVENGIPVLGHIGLTPQSIRSMGGYKVQGRLGPDAKRLIADAKALEKAGVFAIVLECLPSDLGARITRAVKIPTIGIGAGPGCDGQILVTHDLLGLHANLSPKFARRYAELGTAMRHAFDAYKKDVQSGSFPGPENCY